MGKKKVVVVGGGFAGINVVKRLDERWFNVLLIDKINHHQFHPPFYQVVTSQIEPSNISFTLRHILKHRRNVKNKLIIFINWARAYMTKDTTLRLILKEIGIPHGPRALDLFLVFPWHGVTYKLKACRVCSIGTLCQPLYLVKKYNESNRFWCHGKHW